MKILMTGGAGYIGTWLRQALPDHEVVVADLPTDLLVPGVMTSLLADYQPDWVVHLAAGVGRERCEEDYSATVRANTELTVQVATACGDTGTPMLHISTSEVYGPGEHRRRVDEPLAPINLYGLSKKWAEEAATFYAQATIARLSMPYGPGSPPGPGRCALHNFLWDAHLGQPLVVHEDTWRSWCWAGDTARALRILLEDVEYGTIWNVGRSDDLRLTREVAELAMKVAGREVEIIEVPRPRDVTRIKDYDTSALDGLWAPAVDLEEGMEQTLQYLVWNHS